MEKLRARPRRMGVFADSGKLLLDLLSIPLDHGDLGLICRRLLTLLAALLVRQAVLTEREHRKEGVGVRVVVGVRECEETEALCEP
jgi:hypothetical protein